MLFPKDSSLIASSKITIKWRTEEADRLYYIFIKNLTTKEIIKIETNGSQLGLYDENLIFNEGNTFEWAVTTDAFPSIKNLMFYSFSIIDRNEYEALKLNYKEFVNDLERLGIGDEEISNILCETYGLCK